MSRRVVDCTKVLRHGAAVSFTAHEFERDGQPQTLVHRIEMDADVGTHILAPRRYARWGSDLADLAPTTFFGEGLVAHLQVTSEAPDIDSDRLEDAFGREIRSRDIVVIAAHGDGVTPSFTAQAAQWLFVRGAKLVALADGVCIGRKQEPDDERVILSTLLENDVPVVRGLVNAETLSTERMAFMALPAPAADLTAWPVRFIALDPGLDPTQEAPAEEPAVDQPVQPEPVSTGSATDPEASEPAASESEFESEAEPSEPDAPTDQDADESPPRPESENQEATAVQASSDVNEDEADTGKQSTEA